MARRQFRDSNGQPWDVWDVRPTDVPDGAVLDRRGSDRPRTERKQSDDARTLLAPDLEDGWLCFQSAADRRRFAPIPPGWIDLPDGVLRVMLEIASPVSPAAPPEKPRDAPVE